MKPLFFLTASLILLFGMSTRVSAQHTNPKFEFSESGYGIYTSQTVEKEAIDGSASIKHAVVTKQVLVEKTEKVPAKRGVQFGTVYKLIGKEGSVAHLEIEWIYPHEIMDTAKNARYPNIRYPINLPINEENSSCYSLDDNFEIVKGTWTINIYSDNKIIFTRKFDLY